MKRGAPKVSNDGDKPIPEDILAQAIVDIAEAAKRMNSSRLNRTAVLVLLKHATGYPMHMIARVLDEAENLAKNYVKR